MAAAGFFPSRPAALSSRSKIAGPAILRCASAASLRSAVQGPARPPPFVAVKAARGAADPTKGRSNDDVATNRPTIRLTISPTLMPHRLQLYGYRPFQDEPDPRPLPESRPSQRRRRYLRCPDRDLGETRLEPDLEDLLWSTVNVFHRAAERIERDLDDNELAQRSQKDQDGSEVNSVELERLTAEGITLIERRNIFELS